MKEITIDCAGIGTPQALHAAIAREMGFPEWYGNNLDALHDCLTAVAEDTELSFVHFQALPFPTGGFLRVLRDAEAENLHLHIAI